MSDLRALAAKATPGRWANRGCATPGYRCVALSRRRDEPYTIGPMLPADAAYVAAIDPTTLLALLDERDALRERLRMHGVANHGGTHWTPVDGHMGDWQDCPHGVCSADRAALASARAGAGEGGE